ncbi:hypothetical protein BDW67DRAFT_112370 [Aspergillus spinulosporus]
MRGHGKDASSGLSDSRRSVYGVQLTKTRVETNPWDLQVGGQSPAVGSGRLRSTAYDVAKVSPNGSPTALA